MCSFYIKISIALRLKDQGYMHDEASLEEPRTLLVIDVRNPKTPPKNKYNNTKKLVYIYRNNFPTQNIVNSHTYYISIIIILKHTVL